MLMCVYQIFIDIFPPNVKYTQTANKKAYS